MQSDTFNFNRRAQLTELMDEPCSYAELRECLRDLMSVNRTVFTYRPTLNWLEHFAAQSPGLEHQPLHVVDVGSGAGDMLRRIERWARNKNIEWVTCDAYSYKPDAKIDLVISSLFTHHLADVEIVEFLRWMEQVAVRGWFVNDLHRGRVPYYAFTLLANTMRWHKFVRHDGPVSVRRSFSAEDWMRYLSEAELDEKCVEVYTQWPGRLCVSRVKR